MPKWAMAAAALLVVALMLARFQPQDPARWAVVQEPDILSRSQGKGPVEEAHDLTLTGDYLGAARRLEAEIQGGHEDVRIRLYLAYVYLKQDRDRAAVELLDQCLTVAQAPLDDEARWLRANALLKNRQVGQARTAFEEIAGRGRAHHQQARAVLEKLSGTK